MNSQFRLCQTFEACNQETKLTKFVSYCQSTIKEYQKNKSSNGKPPKVIVFVSSTERSNVCAYLLNEFKIHTVPLNSSQNDEFYAKALNLFTQGTVSTIVASDDVIGKLANVREFDYIVNLDLPKNPSIFNKRAEFGGNNSNVGFMHSFYDINADVRIGSKLVKMLRTNNDEIPDFMLGAQKSSDA